mmetsp:Transcript_129841/g.277155  ORF Transcript_129841/g.277155 Transcript_129841/m.277155 type:complete len:228 (-) Transcript_129841:1648-2331(-)
MLSWAAFAVSWLGTSRGQRKPPFLELIDIGKLDLQLGHLDDLPTTIREQEDDLQMELQRRCCCNLDGLTAAALAIATAGTAAGQSDNQRPLVNLFHARASEVHVGIGGPMAGLRGQEQQLIANGEPHPVPIGDCTALQGALAKARRLATAHAQRTVTIQAQAAPGSALCASDGTGSASVPASDGARHTLLHIGTTHAADGGTSQGERGGGGLAEDAPEVPVGAHGPR